MLRGLFLLSALALGLAGCGKPQPSLHEQEAQAVREVSTLTGWSRLFASPLETIGAINQAGFGVAQPAANEAYRAEGRPQMLSSSFAKAPNRGNVVVTGATPKTVDTIVYSLDLTDPADAATARKRLGETAAALLTKFKIDDTTPLQSAIAAGKAGTIEIAGLPVVVAATPARLDVTFTRPALRAGQANPAPAGNANPQG